MGKNKQWSEMTTAEKAGLWTAIAITIPGFFVFVFLNAMNSSHKAPDKGPIPTDFVVEKEYVGCITERLFDEAMDAAVAKDMEGFRRKLYAGGCYPLQGRRVHVIDKGFTVAKVRAETARGDRELYVPTQMLLDARK